MRLILRTTAWRKMRHSGLAKTAVKYRCSGRIGGSQERANTCCDGGKSKLELHVPWIVGWVISDMLGDQRVEQLVKLRTVICNARTCVP